MAEDITPKLPQGNRWQKFTGKAPRFTDPAEATFEVMIDTKLKLVIPNCIWVMTNAKDQFGTKYDHIGFHCISFGMAVPIASGCITHWRRS